MTGRAGTQPGWWRGRATMKTEETFSAKGSLPESSREQTTVIGFKAAYDGTILSHDYKMKYRPETKFEQPLTLVHL